MWPLVVQVYTQVLMKSTSKQVIKTWSIKENINQYDHCVKCTCLRVMISTIVKL